MKRKILIFLLAITVIIFLTFGSGCGSDAVSSSLVLNAVVDYRSGSFLIFNNGNFDWINVKLFLNYEGDNLSSGYQYYTTSSSKEIWAHSSTMINDYEFRNAKGDQFHSTLPLEELDKLLIQADTPDGKKGSYLKTW